MNFTKEQIKFMKSIGLNLDFNNLSDDDYANIEEVVGDKLTLECLDEYYNPNNAGLLCESILDLLAQF